MNKTIFIYILGNLDDRKQKLVLKFYPSLVDIMRFAKTHVRFRAVLPHCVVLRTNVGPMPLHLLFCMTSRKFQPPREVPCCCCIWTRCLWMGNDRCGYTEFQICAITLPCLLLVISR